MRLGFVACALLGVVIAACSAARQDKPNLPPPEYEPARSLDITPKPAAPAASASAEPDSDPQ
jgi:hypothetical protein